jgi:hypothetical protein
MFLPDNPLMRCVAAVAPDNPLMRCVTAVVPDNPLMRCVAAVAPDSPLMRCVGAVAVAGAVAKRGVGDASCVNAPNIFRRAMTTLGLVCVDASFFLGVCVCVWCAKTGMLLLVNNSENLQPPHLNHPTSTTPPHHKFPATSTHAALNFVKKNK